jgi:two-component system response regulator MprA
MARFLVVDDDQITVHGMTRLLTDDGHDVAPFTKGADAVDALSRECFDAVLTDLEMPHVDGHAVVRVTREHSPRACLVVVTARADEKGQELADAGACIIVDKPIDLDGVTKVISECRARGGPGAHGRCHQRSHGGEPPLTKLRRR